jgi:hypothetical protein
LGFDILLLFHWILSAFRLLILWVAGLIIKVLLQLVIFLVLLSFAGLIKKSSIAQSTTEAEYVVAVRCCSQILWIVHSMRDFGVKFESSPHVR